MDIPYLTANIALRVGAEVLIREEFWIRLWRPSPEEGGPHLERVLSGTGQSIDFERHGMVQ